MSIVIWQHSPTKHSRKIDFVCWPKMFKDFVVKPNSEVQIRFKLYELKKFGLQLTTTLFDIPE